MVRVLRARRTARSFPCRLWLLTVSDTGAGAIVMAMGGLVILVLVLVIVLGVGAVFAAAIQRAKEDFDTSDMQSLKEKRLSYKTKQYFFNQSELVFFEILNAHIDAHRYTIFPKVRLGDLVEVESDAHNKYGLWARIRARHIDYVIWDLVEKKIVLAIELDGKSHNGSKAKEADGFKDQVFETVGLTLHRIHVGQDFEEAARDISHRIAQS